MGHFRPQKVQQGNSRGGEVSMAEFFGDRKNFNDSSLREEVLNANGNGEILVTTLQEGLFERSQYETLNSFLIREVPRRCFSNSAFKTVSFSCSLCRIGEEAFQNCIDLVFVSLGAPLRSLGARCFKNCKSLKEVVLPVTLREVDPTSFDDCPNLQRISMERTFNVEALEALRVLKDKFPACKVVLTRKDRYSVAIKDKSFLLREIDQFIESVQVYSRRVVITKGVEVLKRGTVNIDGGITEVVLPKSLKVIEEGFFCGFKALKRVVFQSMVTEIGSSAFYDCTSLEHIDVLCKGKLVENVLPVRTLGDSVFSYCFSLKNLKLLGTESLGKSVFSNCYDLESVVLSSPIKKLPRTCFSNCSSLESVELTVPSALVSIENNCFSNCIELKSFDLKELNSLKYLGGASFQNSGIRRVECFTESLLVDTSCFERCENLLEVALGGKGFVFLKKSSFGECPKLREVSVKSDKIRLENCCFDWCPSLDSVTLRGDDLVCLSQQLEHSKKFRSLVVDCKKAKLGHFYFFSFLSVELIDFFSIESYTLRESFTKHDFNGYKFSPFKAIVNDRGSEDEFSEEPESDFNWEEVVSFRWCIWSANPLSLVLKAPKSAKEVTITYKSGFSALGELWVDENTKVIVFPKFEESKKFKTDTDLQFVKFVNFMGEWKKLSVSWFQMAYEQDTDCLSKWRESELLLRNEILFEVDPESFVLSVEEESKPTSEFSDEDFDGIF